MMTINVPTTDDRLVWDVWLSMWWFPALTVADELGLFDTLADGPATAGELTERLGLDTRGVEILLALLASLGFLNAHEGRYWISDASRNFLLRNGPFYWGGVFARQRVTNPLHATIRDAVTGKAARAVGQSSGSPPVEAWESGELDPGQAWDIARFMQSHSAPAATGVALNGDFSGVTRLLDIGGGSGCFAIALARQYSGLKCTVMDLPAMCRVAEHYIRDAGAGDRVDARAVDMFREEWPRGYDAMFFSNVFHDWALETCAQLARSAHAALSSGGRIYLHEMLIAEGGAGPPTPAAFAMLMLTATRGRQFTFHQLRTLLGDAGFVDVDVTATYGYYSLIRATKRG